MRIGVLGHYGAQNLGDEAIVAAAIQNIRAMLPGAEICGFLINPEDTQARHDIRAYPVRRRVGRSRITNSAPDPIATRSHAFDSNKNMLKRIAPLYLLIKRGRIAPEPDHPGSAGCGQNPVKVL
jgi:polysaccharide pyruvyl transferase WcaK-like protein